MEKKKNLESNLWKYTLFLITQLRGHVAIIGAFYLNIPEVTPAVIGTIFLLGNIASILFEIPSGYLSDRMGHKNALILSKVLLAVSTLCFLLAENIPFLIAGAIFWQIGFAFHSGTGTAFMHDTLRALKREKEYSRILGRSHAIGLGIPILFQSMLPFLVDISGYQALFSVVLFFDIIGIIFATLLVSPPTAESHIKEIDVVNLKNILAMGWRMRFFRYALFFGIIGGVPMGINQFRAPYQTEIGIPVIWLGVLFGIGRFLATILLSFNGKIESLFSRKRDFFFLNTALFLIPSIALGLFSSPWIIATMFILQNAIQLGLSEIKRGQMLDILQHSRFKATLLSVKEQFASFSAGLTGLFVGYFAQNLSYPTAFLWVIGISFLLLLFPLFFILNEKTNTNNKKYATK